MKNTWRSSAIALNDPVTTLWLDGQFKVSKAAGTKSNYKSSLNAWIVYCVFHLIHPLKLPYNPHDIGTFFASRTMVVSYKVHSNDLAALNWLYEELELKNNFFVSETRKTAL